MNTKITLGRLSSMMIVLVTFISAQSVIGQSCSGTSFDLDEDEFPQTCITSNGADGTATAASFNHDFATNTGLTYTSGTDGIDDVTVSMSVTCSFPNGTNGTTVAGACFGPNGLESNQSTPQLETNVSGGSDFGGATVNDNPCANCWVVVEYAFINGFMSTADGFDLAWTSMNGSTQGLEAWGGWVEGTTFAAPPVNVGDLATYCNAQAGSGITMMEHITGTAAGAALPAGVFRADFVTGATDCPVEEPTSSSGPNSNVSTGMRDGAIPPNWGLSSTDVIDKVTMIYLMSNSNAPDCDGNGFTESNTSPSGSLSTVDFCVPVESVEIACGECSGVGGIFVTEVNSGAGTDSNCEYVEIFNAYNNSITTSSTTTVTISGGVDYDFPEGTIIPAGGYVVIARSISGIANSSGTSNCPFTSVMTTHAFSGSLTPSENVTVTLVCSDNPSVDFSHTALGASASETTTVHYPIDGSAAVEGVPSPGEGNCTGCDAAFLCEPQCPDLSGIAEGDYDVGITESTCAEFGGTPSGGSLTAPVACLEGSTLMYSIDNGVTWSTTLPTYNQTTSITIDTRCECDADASVVSETSSVTTTPGACPPCPVLSSIMEGDLDVGVTESSCSTVGGTPEGGSLSAPTNGCPTGSTLEYTTDGGTTWSNMLPTYDQEMALTVMTRCTCDADDTMTSVVSSVTTDPGECPVCPTDGMISYDGPQCEGEGFLFTATATGANRYRFFVDTNGNGIEDTNEIKQVEASNTWNSTNSATLSDMDQVCVTLMYLVISCEATVCLTVDYFDTPACSTEDITICEGEDIDLTETGGDAVAWSWSGPNGFTSSMQNPTLSGGTSSAAGTYSVVVTDDNNCTSSCEAIVTVNPLPQINENTFIEACGNGSTSADYNLTDAENINNGDVDGDGANGSTSIVSYFLSMSDAETCTNQLADGMGLSSSPIYAKVESAAGCISIVEVELRPITPPSINLSATSTSDCAASTADGTITLSGLAPLADYSIELTATGGLTETRFFSSDNDGAFVVSNLAAGSYTLVLVVTTASTGFMCSSAPQMITVTQPNAPSASVNSPSVCVGTTSIPIEFTADCPVANYQIDYDDAANATGFQDIDTSTPSTDAEYIIPMTASPETYRGVLTLFCENFCSTNIPFEITLEEDPIVELTQTTIACPGEEHTFEASPEGMDQYVFYTDVAGDGEREILQMGPSATLSAAIDSGVQLFVEATNPDDCSGEAALDVAVLDDPTAIMVTTQPDAICGQDGSSVDLLLVEYNIDDDDLTFYSDDPSMLTETELMMMPPLLSSSVVSPTVTTTYFVVYTDPITGCQSMTTVEVTVDNTLCCDVSGVNEGAFIRGCEDPQGSFMADYDLTDAEDIANGDVDGDGMDGSSTATVTYHMTEEDAQAGVNEIPDGMDLTNADIYARVSFGPSCFAVVSVGVQLFTPPSFEAMGSPATICGGTDGSIVLSNISPGGIFLIYTGPEGSVASGASIAPDANNEFLLSDLTVGTYMVSLENRPNGLNCQSAIVEIEIGEPKAPSITVNDPVVCVGTTEIPIEFTTDCPVEHFLVEYDEAANTAGLEDMNTSGPAMGATYMLPDNLEPGVYNGTVVSVCDNFCNDTDAFTITIVEPQNLTLTQETEGCTGEELVFTAAPAGLADYTFYTDVDSDGVEEILQSGSSETFMTTALADGVEIFVRATIMGDCTEEASSTVVRMEPCPVYDVALMKVLLSAGPFGVGDIVEFSIEVFNQGNQPVYQVQVADYLPLGLDFLAMDNMSTAFSNNPDTPGGGTVTGMAVTNSALPAGESLMMTIFLRVGDEAINGTLFNAAEIIAATQDPEGLESINDQDDNLETTEGGLADEDDNNVDDETAGGTDNAMDEDDFDFAALQVCTVGCNGTFPWNGQN